MIIDEDTKPARKIALPEPRHGFSWRFTPSEGWNSILYLGEAGRIWRIDFGSEDNVVPTETGIVVPISTDFRPVDFAADRAIFEYADHMHVFDVSSGREIVKIPFDSVCGVCLTPDGRYLLWFEEDRDTQIWSLDDKFPTPTATKLFHTSVGVLPGFGYEPHSAAHTSRLKDGSQFHIVVGHYGFAVEYPIAYDGSMQPKFVISAAPRIYTEFVFDPISTMLGNQYPFVGINHGYGSGIKLIDVECGELRSCPDVAEKKSLSYARYFDALPTSDKTKVLIETTDGWFLWDLSTDCAHPFCSLAIEPVHFDGSLLWAVKTEDPASLFLYSCEEK